MAPSATSEKDKKTGFVLHGSIGITSFLICMLCPTHEYKRMCMNVLFTHGFFKHGNRNQEENNAEDD
jgi:hypothetical protein